LTKKTQVSLPAFSEEWLLENLKNIPSPFGKFKNRIYQMEAKEENNL